MTACLWVRWPQGATTVDVLPGQRWILGQGAGANLQLNEPALAARHLSLVAGEGEVIVEQLRGASGVRLNGVPLQAMGQARAGDEISIGDVSLVVLSAQGLARRAVPVRLLPFDEFSARFDDEVRHALTPGSTALMLMELPALNNAARQALLRRLVEATAPSSAHVVLGQVGGDLLAASVSHASAGEVRTALEQLRLAGGARARVVTASVSVGATGDELWNDVYAQLADVADNEDFIADDPVMVRLKGLVETIEGTDTLCVQGEAGSGRAQLLRYWAHIRGRPLKLVRGADGLAAVDLARLDEEARAQKALLGVTCSSPATSARFAWSVRLPGLSTRVADIVPLADAFLSQFRTARARPRLRWAAEARQALARYTWPGNVAQLRHVVARATWAALRDDVGLDALPASLTREAPQDNLRGALKSTERELMLEALGRTRWNVTAAAARLGLPRRTVVYRMARLGLKRPTR